eukprot:tig00021070_g17842.t1
MGGSDPGAGLHAGQTVLPDVVFAQPVPLTEQRQQKPGTGYTYTHAGHTHDGNVPAHHHRPNYRIASNVNARKLQRQ